MEFEQMTRSEENECIQLLREYYRVNFQNGESDECFLIWVSERLKEVYGLEEAVY